MDSIPKFLATMPDIQQMQVFLISLLSPTPKGSLPPSPQHLMPSCAGASGSGDRPLVGSAISILLSRIH